MDPESFICCHSCGHEFPSRVFGALLAVSNSETCPSCGSLTSSGDFIEGRKFRSKPDEDAPTLIRRTDADKLFSDFHFSYNNLPNHLDACYSHFRRNMDKIKSSFVLSISAPPDLIQIAISSMISLIVTCYEELINQMHTALISNAPQHNRDFIVRRDAIISKLRTDITPDDLDMLQMAFCMKNCLQHRGGIVDNKFNYEANKIASFKGKITAPIGIPLSPPREMAVGFTQSLGRIANALLSASYQ